MLDSNVSPNSSSLRSNDMIDTKGTVLCFLRLVNSFVSKLHHPMIYAITNHCLSRSPQNCAQATNLNNGAHFAEVVLMIPFLPGLAMMSRHLLVRPKVDIRREPDVSVTPNFVKTQSSNPVVNADPKLEFSVDHSPVTAQPKPVSHSVTTPPTTPNVFR
ncbi:hypothetical protein RJ639_022193 [Escallonia herrerae]|uniref:Uncharacterized protein n=1 Tax=Escallonia herrerae TaxID=1293975 RepID=A0AA89AG00_9ASTE|nr:hypothetical protein RJ639_022193 [Escallonia herrerae]